MWILRSAKGEKYLLVCNKEHIVGRKTGDLILQDDDSISRVHAKIRVAYSGDKEMENIQSRPSVILIDCGSKYGTFVNEDIIKNVKLTNGEEVSLKNGDKVRFGLQWHEWTLVHEPLIITTSTLKPDEKAALTDNIATLGGHIVSKWYPSCTHVVMTKLTFTIKVACALAVGIPIVTPEYWNIYLIATSSRKTTALPDYKDHIPPLAEVSLMEEDISFTVNEKRKTLFKGKLFIFHSVQQLQAFSCMIAAAGGTFAIADTSGKNYEDMVLPHVIVLKYPFEKNSQDTQIPDAFRNLRGYVESKGLRLIPESEIGLAILHCSLERYCNPKFVVLSPSESHTQKRVPSSTTSVAALDDNELSQLSLTLSRERRIIKKPVVIEESHPDEYSSVISMEERKPSVTVLDDSILSSVNDDKNNISRTGVKRLDEIVNKRQRSSDEDDDFHVAKRISSTNTANVKMSSKQRNEQLLSKNRPIEKEDCNQQSVLSCLKVKSNQKASKSCSSRFREFEVNDDAVDDYDEEDMFAFVTDKTSPIKNQNEQKKSWWNSAEDKQVERKRKLSENGVENEPEIRNTKKVALESHPFVHSDAENVLVLSEGFISTTEIKQENEDAEQNREELSEYARGLRNMTILDIEILPLRLSKNNSTSLENTKGNYSSHSNFKKFRKVRPIRESVLPCIIGGSDLIPCSTEATQITPSLHNISEDEDSSDDFQFVSTQRNGFT